MKQERIVERLEQIIIDLEELESINYLPHQVEKLKRLKKELDDSPSTEVHGGGTGRD